MLVRIAVIALVLLFAGFAVGACGRETDSDSFFGYWEETGTGDWYSMQIVPGATSDSYAVNYRRFYPKYGEFRLEGDQLVYSPVSPDMTDVITYDADSDTITITSGAGGDSRTLIRVESP